MERMADYKPQERQDLEELYRKQNVRIYELEQENKKLNDKIAHLEFDIEAWRQLKSVMEGGIEELVEDYKALGILNDEIRRVNENLREDKKKLKEKVRFLEECLDNKEKVNKSLREENKKLKKYYDRDKEELMESCYSLAKENEKLKSDLDECECSFGFESDEVGFWKREYKRLKKWIKDHCKGYGNLFPEDEMKRQWKKADKKRKKETLKEELISRIRQPKNVPYGKGVAELMEEDTLQELRDIGEI